MMSPANPDFDFFTAEKNVEISNYMTKNSCCDLKNNDAQEVSIYKQLLHKYNVMRVHM